MAKRHPRHLARQRPRVMLALVLALGCIAQVVRADSRTCIAAHEQGQLQQREGRLVEALTSFATCAAPSCPAVIRDDCSERHQILQPRIPSLRLSALDRQGEATTDVIVRLDGKPLDAPFEGRPIPVDPGEHRVHFQAPWGEARQVVVTAETGAGSTTVVGDFRADAVASRLPPPPGHGGALPPPPDYGESEDDQDDQDDGVSAGPWILGGSALLSFGVFALLAVSGTTQENLLLDECAPACAEEEVDKMRRRYAGADVALALGSGLLVGAIIWLAVDLSSADDDSADQTSVETSSATVTGAPEGLGLGASIRF